jgi:hypothetical protein
MPVGSLALDRAHRDALPVASRASGVVIGYDGLIATADHV